MTEEARLGTRIIFTQSISGHFTKKEFPGLDIREYRACSCSVMRNKRAHACMYVCVCVYTSTWWMQHPRHTPKTATAASRLTAGHAVLFIRR